MSFGIDVKNQSALGGDIEMSADGGGVVSARERDPKNEKTRGL
jgi:hypothetical protein